MKKLTLITIVIIGIFLNTGCKKDDDDSANNNQSCPTTAIGTGSFFKVINSLNTEVDVDFSNHIPYSCLINGNSCHIFEMSFGVDYVIGIEKWNQGNSKQVSFNLTEGEVYEIVVDGSFFR